MDSRQIDLSQYRMKESADSLKEGIYKDSINRSYYAAFYAIKAVLALGMIDFKRHKDVVAHFNKEYVAKEIFPREIGRRLGTLKQLREKSDYDDFFIASKKQAVDQYETAKVIHNTVKEYITSTRN